MGIGSGKNSTLDTSTEYQQLIYYILFYTTSMFFNGLGHPTDKQPHTTGFNEGNDEMFIGISCKYMDAPESDFRMRSFDASRIVMVEQHNERPNETVFWFDDGFQGYALTTDSYDEAGLIELIMQARLNPAEFLPSRYVGKGEEAETISTGSLRWKANDARKK